jgi:hypothetical protein
MMLLQSIIDCSVLAEPLWTSVKARLTGRRRNRDNRLPPPAPSVAIS